MKKKKVMNKRRADAGNIGSLNTIDHFADNQRVCTLDYAEKIEVLQSDLLENLKQNKKVIRLFRCFGCEKNYALKKMSLCLIVCRKCYLTSRGKSTIAKNNFIEKTANNFRNFFRRRI